MRIIDVNLIPLSYIKNKETLFKALNYIDVFYPKSVVPYSLFLAWISHIKKTTGVLLPVEVLEEKARRLGWAYNQETNCYTITPIY